MELGYTDPEGLFAATIFLEALSPETQATYEELYSDVRAGA